MRDSESLFKILRLRPRNFGWPCIAVFLLYPDLSMRGFSTAWLINKFSKSYPGRQWVKNYLSVLAAPELDDICLHRVIFKIAGANGNLHPRDSNFVGSLIAFCAQHF